ncbi:hypothetical protein SCHPADRAFT_932844 [Schizopora paradoxa]|uniref:BTB domain-containing protein n=1 Tax=Schizopora paradoxa TaxID=27342 RepID=A0A0H2R4U7_9AGAM|nr:hypothetical protein SCHPADRAFT_932844 [Schizopora paradoxa]
MNPPAKRVKLMDGSSISNTSADTHAFEDALQHGKPSITNLKHHDVLWYEDGSIVLATDEHLYCVHKSFLASSSSVFKDMLAMPNAESVMTVGSQGTHMGKDEDIYEGKPVVRMFGDSDENVYHLLMALYDRNFFRAGKPTTAPIVLSLLIMSSKYDVPVIQSEVIEHLKSYYVTELPQLRKCEIACKDLFCGSTSNDGTAIDFDAEEFAFQLLDAALRMNTLTLLPAIYYECSILPLGKILSLSNKHSLETEVVEKLLAGHEKLTKLSLIFGPKTLSPQTKCKFNSCLEARSTLHVEWLYLRGYKYPDPPRKLIMSGFACVGTAELRAKLCSECLNRTGSLAAEFELLFWTELPTIFGLGDWGALK